MRTIFVHIFLQVATASFFFFLAFLISIVVIKENKEQTNVVRVNTTLEHSLHIIIFLSFLMCVIKHIDQTLHYITFQNYENLGSSMLSWLQKHFKSDGLKSGDTISTAWNNFFIQVT